MFVVVVADVVDVVFVGVLVVLFVVLLLFMFGVGVFVVVEGFDVAVVCCHCVFVVGGVVCRCC